jgi:RHS repeat-associated protein
VSWFTVFDSAVSGEYPETAAGKTHTFTARSVRYIRDYLNGNTVNAYNHWVELEGLAPDTSTTYLGNYFEWSGSASTMVKYYYAAGVRVAMRVGANNPYFLLLDHLGSTHKVVDSSGAALTGLYYKAWGESRYATGSLNLTSFKFTGQREESVLGLYFYLSRWYDSSLGRFLSADSIIPLSTQGVQAWDRFAYANNNPVRFNDPSGHLIDSGCNSLGCEGNPYVTRHIIRIGAVGRPKISWGGSQAAEESYTGYYGSGDGGINTAWAGAVGVASDGLAAINNSTFRNDANIFVYLTYDVNSDMSVNLSTLTVQNESGLSVSVDVGIEPKTCYSQICINDQEYDVVGEFTQAGIRVARWDV